MPEQRARKASGRADYLKRWRERKASEGCCTRCGRPNDRPGRTCSCCMRLIGECDGLLYVPCGHESVGSAMEIAYAHQQNKPIYIIEPSELAKHVWLRYHASAIYPTWEAFAEVMRA